MLYLIPSGHATELPGIALGCLIHIAGMIIICKVTQLSWLYHFVSLMLVDKHHDQTFKSEYGNEGTDVKIYCSIFEMLMLQKMADET